MPKSIAVLNYGIGNIRSIQNALIHLGYNPNVTDKKDQIMNSDILIIPGVGSFGYGIEQINRKQLRPIIQEYANSGKKVIGICLGMQLMLSIGSEGGTHKGLDLIPGRVDLLTEDKNIRIPNIGWKEITTNNKKFKNITENQKYYFVHSYCCNVQNSEHVLFTTSYESINFTSAIKKDNIYGFQFHPEKSGPSGLKLLKNVLEE